MKISKMLSLIIGNNLKFPWRFHLMERSDKILHKFREDNALVKLTLTYPLTISSIVFLVTFPQLHRVPPQIC